MEQARNMEEILQALGSNKHKDDDGELLTFEPVDEDVDVKSRSGRYLPTVEVHAPAVLEELGSTLAGTRNELTETGRRILETAQGVAKTADLVTSDRFLLTIPGRMIEGLKKWRNKDQEVIEEELIADKVPVPEHWTSRWDVVYVGANPETNKRAVFATAEFSQWLTDNVKEIGKYGYERSGGSEEVCLQEMFSYIAAMGRAARLLRDNLLSDGFEGDVRKATSKWGRVNEAGKAAAQVTANQAAPRLEQIRDAFDNLMGTRIIEDEEGNDHSAFPFLAAEAPDENGNYDAVRMLEQFQAMVDTLEAVANWAEATYLSWARYELIDDTVDTELQRSVELFVSSFATDTAGFTYSDLVKFMTQEPKKKVQVEVEDVQDMLTRYLQEIESPEEESEEKQRGGVEKGSFAFEWMETIANLQDAQEQFVLRFAGKAPELEEGKEYSDKQKADHAEAVRKYNETCALVRQAYGNIIRFYIEDLHDQIFDAKKEASKKVRKDTIQESIANFTPTLSFDSYFSVSNYNDELAARKQQERNDNRQNQGKKGGQQNQSKGEMSQAQKEEHEWRLKNPDRITFGPGGRFVDGTKDGTRAFRQYIEAEVFPQIRAASSLVERHSDEIVEYLKSTPEDDTELDLESSGAPITWEECADQLIEALGASQRLDIRVAEEVAEAEVQGHIRADYQLLMNGQEPRYYPQLILPPNLRHQ